MNMSLQQSQPMHFANMKRKLQPSKAARAQPRNGRVQKTQRAKAKDRQARTRAQHARRMRCRAADLVVQVIAQLLRLQVLVITSMSAATEVARMKVMVATMKSRRFTVPDIVGVLFLDFAARAPDLSMAFHRMVAKRPLPKGRAKSCGIQLLQEYHALAVSQEWRTFWTGPTRLNMWNFLCNADLQAVQRIACLFSRASSMRSTEVLNDIMTMKYFDRYSGFSLLRSVCEAMSIRLRTAQDDATHMSLHTSLMAELLPFADTRKKLHTILGFPPSDSILAYIYCETTKVLLEEKVLAPLPEYVGSPALFAQHLSDDIMKMLVERMAAMPPVHESDSEETRQVKNNFPTTAHLNHHTASTLWHWRSICGVADNC